MAPPGRPRRAEGTIRALIGARLLIGLVVTALLLIGGGAVKRTSAATTATTTLVATDDGSVSSSRPMKTFGTADRLQVDASPVLRSYLKFDLSSIDGTVTSAVLKLTATSASKVGFGVREVADSSWSESRLRFANAPDFSGSIGVSAGAFASKQVISLDVTASVKAGIRSFALVDRGSSTALSVGSSENRRLAVRPRLVVTHTPPSRAERALRSRYHAAPESRPRDLDLDGEQAVRRRHRLVRRHRTRISSRPRAGSRRTTTRSPIRACRTTSRRRPEARRGSRTTTRRRRTRSTSRASTARSRPRARRGATTRRALRGTARSRRAAGTR